jgi:predicted nucleotidyltransferase
VSILAQVVQALEGRQVPFALIGAAAMAAHGVSRSTYDTDLLCVGRTALDPSLWRPLEASGIAVEVREGDDDDPLLGVVRFTKDGEAIDLVVGRSQWQRAILERATRVTVLSVELPIATVEDLVVLKLYAGGTQDRWDIEQLLAAARSRIALDAIDAQVRALPERCQSLWRGLRPRQQV